MESDRAEVSQDRAGDDVEPGEGGAVREAADGLREAELAGADFQTIREDLHSIYRCVTASGNITYRAPHTEDGHSDRGSAQALCTRAGEGAAGGGYSSILI